MDAMVLVRPVISEPAPQLVLFEGLVFEELSSIDLGMQINQEMGKVFFKPGEWMQFVCIVAGLKVWIFRDARMGWHKVSFGETPEPFSECEWLSREEAEDVVMAKVMEYQNV